MTTLLSKLVKTPIRKEQEMNNPEGQVYKIKFKAVYQYRNRWVLGLIEGKLDTFARKFTQTEKKKGVRSIKDSRDAADVSLLTKEFVTLRHFLAHKIAVRHKNMFASATPVQEEAKYLERLVLKGCKVNRMWVDYDSIVL